jgi:hypothetical protein
MRCCAPACPVSIPDAVYTEATRAPGADRIVAWINDHLDMGRIVPTDIGIDQQRRLDEGRSARGLANRPRSHDWSPRDCGRNRAAHPRRREFQAALNNGGKPSAMADSFWSAAFSSSRVS